MRSSPASRATALIVRRLCAGLLVLSLTALPVPSRFAFAQGTSPVALPPGGGAEIRAQLTARQFTTLSSEISGRIDHVNTRVGEHFQKGDVLVQFDCAIPMAQRDRAEAVVAQSEKVVAIDNRLLLLKSVGQLEVEVAQAELAKARADLSITRATVSKCTIEAPFSGVTTELKAREYQYATPGQPLLDILDDHSVEVELIAPSRWLNWLKVGTKFNIRIEETDTVYPAEVTRIGGRVDPVSQSIKVIGEIKEPSPRLMAGMSGEVLIAPPK